MYSDSVVLLLTAKVSIWLWITTEIDCLPRVVKNLIVKGLMTIVTSLCALDKNKRLLVWRCLLRVI